MPAPAPPPVPPPSTGPIPRVLPRAVRYRPSVTRVPPAR
jgi:hypothetical protein